MLSCVTTTWCWALSWPPISDMVRAHVKSSLCYVLKCFIRATGFIRLDLIGVKMASPEVWVNLAVVLWLADKSSSIHLARFLQLRLSAHVFMAYICALCCICRAAPTFRGLTGVPEIRNSCSIEHPYRCARTSSFITTGYANVCIPTFTKCSILAMTTRTPLPGYRCI